jgi:2-amino-4-hydroxy-6-hydroxymethyldihydropteridine diphosphokinase/dihydropteroate synthase
MVYISLGSNLGNRLNNLWCAVTLLKQRCLKNVQHSIVLETKAILPKQAPYDWDRPFLNMIIAGETNFSPIELLYVLKNIEKEMGRPQNREKWAPRIIDLDILQYNDLIIQQADLVIPHPGLRDRDFLKHLLALMNVKPWVLEQSIDNSFIKSYILEPRLVGIVNVTKDSFSDGGEFYKVNSAVNHVIKLAEEGASIIEIGAQSTRPGAIIQPVEAEHAKLDEVLSKLASDFPNNKLNISIDTFHPSIAVKLIKKYNIHLVNDVTGKFDDHSLRTIADNGCKFCIMHSMSIPPNKNRVVPSYREPLNYLIEWGKPAVERLSTLGFIHDDIIIDPGIGFGKTAYQNINILRNIKRLKVLGCKIMLGHSRKSYINAFSEEANAHSRDLETIGISLAIKNNVDFLRIHNVKDHMRALVSYYTCKIYE